MFGTAPLFHLTLGHILYASAILTLGTPGRARDALGISNDQRKTWPNQIESAIGFKLFDRGIHYPGDHPWSPTAGGKSWLAATQVVANDAYAVEAIASGLLAEANHRHDRSLKLRHILMFTGSVPVSPMEAWHRSWHGELMYRWLGVKLFGKGKTQAYHVVLPYLNDLSRHVINLYTLTVSLSVIHGT